MSGISLEQFRALDAESQRQVLSDMRRQAQARYEEIIREEMVYDRLEEMLVPKIPLKKTAALPPVPDRDAAVRDLMRADTSIREIQTADGVVYRR